MEAARMAHELESSGPNTHDAAIRAARDVIHPTHVRV